MKKLLAAIAFVCALGAPLAVAQPAPPTAVEMPAAKPLPANGAAAAPVIAPTSPVVVIPTGDWITRALDYSRQGLLLVITAAFAWLLRSLPSTLASVLKQNITDKILENALNYAVGAVDGAVKGDVLSLPVANAVIKTAADYVIANAPSFARWLGETLKPKLIARLAGRGALPAASNEALLHTTPVGILKQNV